MLTVSKILFLVLAFLYYVKADSLEDLKKEYTATLVECMKKYEISPADIVQLQEKKMPDNENAKCMVACAYKASGMPINVTAGAQAFPLDGIGRLGHDPPRGPSADWWVLTTADAAGTNGLTCLPKHGGAQDINDQQVNDGNKGCERAALIFKCSLEQAAVFNFE
ncbi:hypothetical protein evm_008377 [Chilo suppressalis]|nr:hypothetical protein evm_008377 [Chilo suppressalis]